MVAADAATYPDYWIASFGRSAGERSTRLWQQRQWLILGGGLALIFAGFLFYNLGT